jgi:hypothetical protein
MQQPLTAQAPRDGPIQDAPLTFDPESNNFLPHPLAIGPVKLDKLIESASSLEEDVGQVEREGSLAPPLLHGRAGRPRPRVGRTRRIAHQG